MTTLYLIRHGSTDYNFSGKFQGTSNISLNHVGLSQAEGLVSYFQKIPLDAVYTSPLLRAVQTATPFSNAKGLPLQTDKALRELDGGLLEGLDRKALLATYPLCVEHLDHSFSSLMPPEGESAKTAYHRICSAIETIAKKNPQKNIAIVSHGFVLNLFLAYVLEIPFAKIPDIPLENTSVTKLTWQSDTGFHILYQNDTTHIPTELKIHTWEEYYKFYSK